MKSIIISLFIGLLLSQTAFVFANANPNECWFYNLNKNTALTPEQLKQDRQVITTLLNAAVIQIKAKDEEIKSKNQQIESNKNEIIKLTASTTASSDAKKSLDARKKTLEAEKKTLEAQKLTIQIELGEDTKKCGGNDANLKADQAALAKAVSDATGGVIPNFYIPISPIFQNLDGNLGSALDLAGLIGNGFKFAVGIAGFLAVVMIVYYSLSYILSGDSFSGKKFSTEKIQDSVIGFLIILCSIVVLRTIDPNIVYLNLNPTKPGQANVNNTDEEKAYFEAGKKEQRESLGISSVGGGTTPPQGNNETPTDIRGGGSTPGGGSTLFDGAGTIPTQVPIGSNGRPGGSAAAPVIFCYKFRTKAGNVLQKKCISGFEACVLDKKQTKKNPALYKFTQCLISTKPQQR